MHISIISKICNNNKKKKKRKETWPCFILWPLNELGPTILSFDGICPIFNKLKNILHYFIYPKL